jgi:hypothetical protein
MSNYDDLTIEELQSAVEQLSNELTEARTKLREKRLAGVRAAMSARKEADLVLNEELKKLGYTNTYMKEFTPNFSYFWRNLP